MPNYTNTQSINNYYASLQEPIRANMRQAENDYNANLEQLRTAKEGQDAQAYRALQRQLKTVPEEMSAAGAQGGMVDSGIAYIKNRYLQGRNDRDTQLAADNAALGRDYQNTLEGYRGQLAQYEQQAAADRAELEYQNALAAASAGGGGGGSGSADDTGLTTPASNEGVADAFNANYGNYKSLPTTAQQMLSNTTSVLNGDITKTNTRALAQNSSPLIKKNVSSNLSSATKRTGSNLNTLDKYQ